MRYENGPNVSDRRYDCMGKQLGGWVSDVAAATATHAAGFAATAAATADSGSGSASGPGLIVSQQINCVIRLKDTIKKSPTCAGLFRFSNSVVTPSPFAPLAAGLNLAVGSNDMGVVIAGPTNHKLMLPGFSQLHRSPRLYDWAFHLSHDLHLPFPLVL